MRPSEHTRPLTTCTEPTAGASDVGPGPSARHPLSSYEVYEGSEGLAALRSAWESLEATGVDHIFQTFAYADMWQRTIGAHSGARPILVALREDGRVVGILPACRVGQNGVPLLTWLGAPLVLDYGDVIFDPAAARTPIDEFVAEALRLATEHARGALLYLSNVRSDARAYPVLLSRLRVCRESAAPFVPIAGTWEEYLGTRGRGLRRALKRRQRSLEESGACEYRVLGPGDQRSSAALARLVSFQRARFGGLVNRTNLFDDRYVRFRSEQAAEPHGNIVALELDGEFIAVSLGAVFRGRSYAVVTGFDEAHAAVSPGLLLAGFSIRSCFENGWNPRDFCWGDEAYKYKWTDSEMKLTTFVSNDIRGAVVAAGAASRRLVGRALHRFSETRRPSGSGASD